VSMKKKSDRDAHPKHTGLSSLTEPLPPWPVTAQFRNHGTPKSTESRYS
jgi:hypothetical protein